MQTLSLLFLVATPTWVVALNSFSEHDVELSERDASSFSAISFGGEASDLQIQQTSRCKAFPGDATWPSQEEWNRLNTSLGGALLNPLPPAAVCYRSSPAFDSAKCDFLLTNASRTTFYLDDPVTILTQWPQGNTCLASRNATGNCTQGGFPVYVVNATSVSHVQAAVNFARNKNVRLIIK